MRGSFRKKRAKVSSINHIKLLIILEGITRSKKDGTKIAVNFAPSVLQIHELNLDDKKRISVLERAGKNLVNKAKEKDSEKKAKGN